MLLARAIPVDDLVANLEVMLDVLGRELPQSMQGSVVDYVTSAIRGLTIADDNSSFLDPGQPLAELTNQYLSALLRYDRHSASALILAAVENRVSIKEVFLSVANTRLADSGNQTLSVSVRSTIAPLPRSSLCRSSILIFFVRIEPSEARLWLPA
jgi:hypothetical protein